MFFLSSRRAIRIPYYISWPSSLASFWLWRYLRLSMLLISLRCNFQIYCRLSLKWDFSNVFLMIRLGLLSFWEKKCHFHHRISKAHSINMAYHCWCEPWSLGWGSVCHVSVLWSDCLPSPTFRTVVFERKSLCGAHIWGVERLLYLCKREYLHHLFGILLHPRFVSSYLFIYLLLYLY